MRLTKEKAILAGGLVIALVLLPISFAVHHAFPFSHSGPVAVAPHHVKPKAAPHFWSEPVVPLPTATRVVTMTFPKAATPMKSPPRSVLTEHRTVTHAAVLPQPVATPTIPPVVPTRPPVVPVLPLPLPRITLPVPASRSYVRPAAPVGSPQTFALQQVGPVQFTCLLPLWMKESGWNTYASNPSGAYGIPQAMPGSKMASAGADWATNPITQVRWGLSYISAVYGSPCNAWQHSQATGWY